MPKFTTLYLPLPPSVNHLYRVGKHRKPYLSGSYRAWVKQAQIMATIQKVPQKIIPGPVSILLEIIRGPGWRSNRDIDNIAKPVLDFLVRDPQHGGWGLLEDDNSQIVQRLEICFGTPLNRMPSEPAGVAVSILPLK